MQNAFFLFGGTTKVFNLYMAGAFQPPSLLSMTAATASETSSRHGRATICTPIGKPDDDVAALTTVAGHPSVLNIAE